MKYTNLGETGLEVSRVCLGCMTYGDQNWVPWVLSEEEAGDHFRTALDLGINFFDTANIYSKGMSEKITGRWLRELSPDRDRYVLATKVFFPMSEAPNDHGLSRKHILAQCDASLRRLGMDYIDLYQIHRFDPDTPIEETLEALDSLVRTGRVRYLGASSMAAWQMSKMLHTADLGGWQRFVSMQNHYNLIYREEEREMIPLCQDQGLGILPWSPLARGLLAGGRTRGGERPTVRAKGDSFADQLYYRDEDWGVIQALESVARERGEAPAKVALAWMLSVPGVTAPIIGTTRKEQMVELAAAPDLTLTSEEIEKLESSYVAHPVLGHQQPASRD